MSDSIDRETALRIARLARIALPDESAGECQQQLSRVLGYIDHLQEADLPEDIEPFFGVCESVNAIRPDETRESFDRDLILKNAPDTDGEFYRVPPVFQ